MALTLCKECKTEISSQAKACPKCGAPNKSRFGQQEAGALVVIALVGAYFLWPSRTEPPAAPATSPPVASVAEKELTPEEKAKKEQNDLRDTRVVTAATYIKNHLRNPESIKWNTILTNADGSTICVTYRAQNGYGGMNLDTAVVLNSKISHTPANFKKYCATAALTEDMKDYVEQVLPLL